MTLSELDGGTLVGTHVDAAAVDLDPGGSVQHEEQLVEARDVRADLAARRKSEHPHVGLAAAPSERTRHHVVGLEGVDGLSGQSEIEQSHDPLSRAPAVGCVTRSRVRTGTVVWWFMTTPEPLVPSRGLNVVHLFCRVSGPVDRSTVVRGVDDAIAGGNQVVTAAIIGHKADLCFMVLGEDLWALRRFQSSLQAAGLLVAESYVSVTEVSEYAGGMPEEMIQARLFPVLPPDGLRAFCFYPMTKRRGEENNWYALSYEDREQLMRQHGSSGRNFRGRVLQVVTGSTGLDDWEWGVTLFGAHVDDLKDCVYTMRFDEASTLYGEFGAFYTGVVGTLDEVLDCVTI